MMTRRDPWTNVMRATAATFAAGLGGADAVTVLPFTLPLGLPDEPARRLARNVQRVLIDEANLAMVDDPGAGAGSFETLTEGLCERAWALFQEIETEGGIEASLAAGKLQARCGEAAAARAGDVANLTAGIVGTSRFPSLRAPAPGVLDVASRPSASGNPWCPALPARCRTLRGPARPRGGSNRAAEGLSGDARDPGGVRPAGDLGREPFRRRRARGRAVARGARCAGSGGGLRGERGRRLPACAGPTRPTRTAPRASRRRCAAEARTDCSWRAARARAGPDVGIDAFVHEGCDALTILTETLDVI